MEKRMIRCDGCGKMISARFAVRIGREAYCGGCVTASRQKQDERRLRENIMPRNGGLAQYGG